jgi:hypothetical protein
MTHEVVRCRTMSHDVGWCRVVGGGGGGVGRVKYYHGKTTEKFATTDITRHRTTSSDTVRHHPTPYDIIRHHTTSSDIVRHHTASYDLVRLIRLNRIRLSTSTHNIWLFKQQLRHDLLNSILLSLFICFSLIWSKSVKEAPSCVCKY